MSQYSIKESQRARALMDSIDEPIVDITDSVTEYIKGKTFTCECGQGFGVDYGTIDVKCPTCNKVCIDRMGGERDPPDESEVADKDQAMLGDFQ